MEGGGQARLIRNFDKPNKKKNEKEKPFSPIFETLIEFGWGGFGKITLRSLILNLKVATQVRGASVRQEAYPW